MIIELYAFSSSWKNLVDAARAMQPNAAACVCVCVWWTWLKPRFLFYFNKRTHTLPTTMQTQTLPTQHNTHQPWKAMQRTLAQSDQSTALLICWCFYFVHCQIESKSEKNKNKKKSPSEMKEIRKETQTQVPNWVDRSWAQRRPTKLRWTSSRRERVQQPTLLASWVER